MTFTPWHVVILLVAIFAALYIGAKNPGVVSQLSLGAVSA